MKYNFDEIINRKNTDCLKWDENERIYGTNDIHPMWVADMDFKAPQEVIDAMEKRLQHGVFGYTFRGEAYHQAIINWVGKRYHWEIERDWITFSPGIVPALSMAILGNTKPGDRVMIMTPVYGPFSGVVKNNGRELIEHQLVNQDGYYTIDFDKLESQVDSRTKMLMLCNPHNPAGRVWSKEELEKISDFVLRHDLILVSDEIHADFIYSGHQHISIASLSPELAQHTITCYAPSKTFGLAGLTTAYVVIPNPKLRAGFEDIMDALEIDGGNIFGTTALTAAYEQGEEWLEELLVYLEANRDYAVDYIQKKIPEIKICKPEGTYLLWLDCSALGFSCNKELDDFIIKQAKLGFNRGPRFGRQCEQFMRMNIGCPRSLLEKGLNQLEQAVTAQRKAK